MNRFLRVCVWSGILAGLGVSAVGLLWTEDRTQLLAPCTLVACILAGLLVLCLLLHRKGLCGPGMPWTAGLALVLEVLVALLCLPGLSREPAQPALATLPPETSLATQPTETEPAETAPTEPEETEPPQPPFAPAAVAATEPKQFGISWEIFSEGAQLTEYQRPVPISLGEGQAYFALPGIATFRGNNYRNEATYGTGVIRQGKMDVQWVQDVGYISEPEWVGCGWTGQPLVVQWDAQTRLNMQLYEEKRLKDGLVEVIYAKMDGYVHFFDLEDGQPTRDPIYLGMVFKGSGSLDPRGYPLLYVGSGLAGATVQQMYIVDLLNGQVLHTQTGLESQTYRWWFAFDASPLVDARTDTLIWPGESGILYTIRLNSFYDREQGMVAVDPEPPVKTRYTSNYSSLHWRSLGYEASPVIVDGYAYLGDNCGLAMCVDLNTLQPVWTQDLQDDINATPLFDWGADGRGYLYMTCSMEYSNMPVPFCKLDAQTGEVVWKQTFDCKTTGDGSGGILSSPLLGRDGTDIEGIVFCVVSHCPGLNSAQLVAMDENDGQILWQQKLNGYTWSSPVALYTPEGKSYLFLSDVNGNARLYDGESGEILDSYAFGETVEASPVVYGSTIVLGTRSAIYLIRVS